MTAPGSISAVHVGAILTVPANGRLQRSKNGSDRAEVGSHSSQTPSIAQWQLLGKSVLDRTVERLQAFGVGEISIITEEDSAPEAPHSATAFWTAWEEAIARCVQFELGTLLLVRVGPYAELDVADWLHFHRETFSTMTQVYDDRGALDLVAVDARRLAQGTGTYRRRLRDLIPGHQRYGFKGYSNRLANVADFRCLVRDALKGLARIRPIGKEISANFWVGEDVRIDRSARIVAPAYIGTHSRLDGACIMSGASAIEQDCHIDYGTSIHDSCVLAGSYVGTGLKLASSIVCQNTLFNLSRDLELQLHDRRLLGHFSSRSRLSRRRAFSSSSPLVNS